MLRDLIVSITYVWGCAEFGADPCGVRVQDIFTKVSLGLPPVCGVEFGTKWSVGTELISVDPYRMAPIELRERKEQLEELLSSKTQGVLARV